MQNENYQGLLFIKDFLTEGVKEQAAWKSLKDEAVADFAAQCGKMLARIPKTRKPNEAQTCDYIINPILNLLEWEKCYLLEESTSFGSRPDALLYDSEEKLKQIKENENRAEFAVALLENKRWQLPLDRRDKIDGTPSSQILRYFNTAPENIDWGILTNGEKWRLYYRRAQSRSEHFLELNIAEIMQLPADEKNHWLRLFMLVFRRDSFLPHHSEHRTFHHVALDEGKNWEQAITDSLSRKIMDEVFPQLAEALAKSVPELKEILTSSVAQRKKQQQRADELLREVRDNTVILLFRLLFVLYAEDRHLLPILNDNYRKHSLRKLRNEIEKIDDNAHSPKMVKYYKIFEQLCVAISEGDSSMSIPPYNGGLFDNNHTPLLANAKIYDTIFCPVINTFSQHNKGEDIKRIHYHDLSVQHLGAMYEQFLEQELYITPVGKVATRLNRFSRKSGGSYYTPDELVRLVIDRTIGEILQQRKNDFIEAQKNLKGEELIAKDSAAQALEIKVCDPAMGSGHFLVSLVDYLADWALSEMSAAEEIENYESPLVKKINGIRQHIKRKAKNGGWEINESQLEDRQIIRRIVLKKCVYGADKNFMAVELSKLSLWLHTFTVGAPLTFLDHHLRCGDSLFGEWGISVREEFNKLDCRLEGETHINKAESAAEEMSEIELLPDSDIEQVSSSKQKYEEMSKKAEILVRAMSLLHVMRWLDAADKDLTPEERKQNKKQRKASAQRILMNLFDRSNGLTPKDKALQKQVDAMIKRESFMHWEAAFPGVWTKWGNQNERKGGFDAIIGNPPWNRMKMQEVEWFAVHMPEVSKHSKSDDRKKAIAKLTRQKHPIIAEYTNAAQSANSALSVARSCGDYPQLGRGDINLYSLFVERALKLAKSDAFIGLLVPSGIYGDKTSSEFFNGITSSKKLHTLFDFENRPNKFFPSVDERFKFCILIFGGNPAFASEAECAYFINDINEIDNKRIKFQSDDFTTLNPNTKNSPIFRSQRDADITLNVYRRVPILNKHLIINGKKREQNAWSVKYICMLHLTNDSHLFKSSEELKKSGYYLTKKNHYERDEDVYVPLYVGRMIFHFNHRASSVVVNEKNIHNPFVSLRSSITQLQDIDFCVMPHSWVNESHINLPPELNWVLGFRNIARSNDERTIIPCLFPRTTVGNSLPILTPILPKDPPSDATDDETKKYEDERLGAIDNYKDNAPFFAANLSSFILDFIARQKMQGTAANWYIMEQLPVIPITDYGKEFGNKTAADIIRSHMLRLTYTATNMAEFAADMGYEGKPFIWDETERLHLRARLDALYFILYGINNDDAEYIMDSFLIVKKDDEKRYGGYLTRDIIIAYMNALKAGASEVEIKLPTYYK